MNIKKLNNSVDMLKEYLGDSLMACDIWITGTGQSRVSGGDIPLEG